MFTAFKRPSGPRRGVTLVEMLVVVALVVLMMVILVQIFQSALGAMSASRQTQELDVSLRAIDSMIRSDLGGVTAKMTPPNDPALKQGYFEYGENSPADAQGEDTDDYLAFTTKAPEGQVFTGRQWLSNAVGGVQTDNQAIQPATITSQVAEVIYFLRNGNLYRRVFLVAPDRAKTLTIGTAGGVANYKTSIFGGQLQVSWQGMNDISCRPLGKLPSLAPPVPVPNDLGDLTNRENRAFRPRFSNDFSAGLLPEVGPDGIPDDNNGDGVPDYYPTLYYNGAGGNSYKDKAGNVVWSPNALTSELVGWNTSQVNSRVAQTNANGYDVYAFPFIYPNMYSVPDGSTVSGTTVTPPQAPASKYGWRHGIFPGQDPTSLAYYNNHSPLDIGDNLPAPSVKQTWWGFPTWRETMASNIVNGGWADPIVSVNTIGTLSQPFGLRPRNPLSSYLLNDSAFLLPLTQPGTAIRPPYSDGAGSASFNAATPNHLWEDELILSNVRSFDVKAYDPSAPLYTTGANGIFAAGYQDLGYGAGSYLTGLTGSGGGVQNAVPWQTVQGIGVSDSPKGFGHEGRMPPLPEDFRYHPRFQGSTFPSGVKTPFGNVGDASPGIIRLNRVWDSWSTAYTNAPDSDIFLNGFLPGSQVNQPIYPSFPPPYPSPLRGIQIQIRVTDPRAERTKVLTIRFDFTDKL